MKWLPPIAVASPSPVRTMNIQFGLCQFNAGCNRNSTAVSGMYGIKIKIAGSTAGAADTGNYSHIVFGKIEFGNSFNNAAGNNAIAAAGAPDMRQNGPDGNIY